VNLDFADRPTVEVHVSLALQPIAIFACSPFTEVSPTASCPRSNVARHRSQSHRHAAVRVRGRYDFERYVDYALQVPMYFVYRDGSYIDVAGASFRDFMAGKLEQLPGE
jgi:glutamate--cysteine ligase